MIERKAQASRRLPSAPDTRTAYGALSESIAAAVERIESASVYRPPVEAEEVVILALLPKEAQRQRFLADIARPVVGGPFPPLMLNLTCRRLRKEVISWDWHVARVPEYRKNASGEYVHIPPLVRVQECWALMVIAGRAAHEIFRLDAWRNLPALDDEGLRIDLAATLHDIGEQMLESARVAAELGEMPQARTPEADHARTVMRSKLEALDIVREAVAGHVLALLTYRDRLRAVDEQTELIRQAERAERTEHRVDDLVRRSSQADVLAAELSSAGRLVAEAVRGRSSALAEVRGDYLTALALR